MELCYDALCSPVGIFGKRDYSFRDLIFIPASLCYNSFSTNKTCLHLLATIESLNIYDFALLVLLLYKQHCISTNHFLLFALLNSCNKKQIFKWPDCGKLIPEYSKTKIKSMSDSFKI